LVLDLGDEYSLFFIAAAILKQKHVSISTWYS
jgi:hypothetical protein